MEITVLSKEKVKPCTPTPPHFENYKLSFFDQMYGQGTNELILFYKTHENHINHHVLKNALSKTLTLFHPLAGEVTPHGSTNFVHCNDNGILYVEARVSTCLSQFLENPDLSKLKKFVENRDDDTLGSVHVTTFDCGGVAIGVVLPHKLFDAAATGDFLNTWAKIARGGNVDDKMPLDFTSSSILFPPRETFPRELLEHWNTMVISKGEFLHKRFMFDAKAIAAIKTKAVSETVPNPTRVEALTAFFWKHLMLAKKVAMHNNITSKVTQVRSDEDSSSNNNISSIIPLVGSEEGSSSNNNIASSIIPQMESEEGCSSKLSYSQVAHTVNLRARYDPPMPNVFGNFAWCASAFYEPSSSGGVIESSRLVEKVREMFESLKGNEKLKALEGDALFMEQMEFMTNPDKQWLSKLDKYIFTSWCRMGLNDVDLGWGKPIWIAPLFIDPSFSWNVEKVLFVESGWSSDGIEAWVLRNKEEMLVLENDEEFLQYASPDPSICVPCYGV